MFAQERHERLRVSGVSSRVTNDTVRALCTSWKEYQKGKCKVPRFKRRREFRTLTSNQNGIAKVIGPNRIWLPKLGSVRCLGLDDRWPTGLEIKAYRIVKRSSGYYLLLVGKVSVDLKTRHPDCAIGVINSVEHANINCSDGKQYRTPQPFHSNLKRLQRLQRQLKRQKAVKGANYQKTLAKIQRLHEKIVRQRRARNHELTSTLAQRYGGVAIEDVKVIDIIEKSSGTFPSDDKELPLSVTSSEADFNQSLYDRAMWQFCHMLKTKIEARENEFYAIPAQNACQSHYVANGVSCSPQLKAACVTYDPVVDINLSSTKNFAEKAPWKRPFKIMGAIPNNIPDGMYLAFAGELKPASALLAGGQQEGVFAPPPEPTGEFTPLG